MGSLADKFAYLNGTKKAIRTALRAKGISVGVNDTFRSYATKIANIDVGGDASSLNDIVEAYDLVRKLNNTSYTMTASDYEDENLASLQETLTLLADGDDDDE